MRELPCGRDIRHILKVKSAKQLVAAEKPVDTGTLNFIMDMAGSVIACCDCAKGGVIVGCEFNSEIG